MSSHSAYLRFLSIDPNVIPRRTLSLSLSLSLRRAGLHDCDSNAECENTIGSFECICRDNWQSDDPCGDDHAGRTVEVADADMADAACKDSGGSKHGSGCYDIDDCASGQWHALCLCASCVCYA